MPSLSTIKQKIAQNGLRKLGKAIKTANTQQVRSFKLHFHFNVFSAENRRLFSIEFQLHSRLNFSSLRSFAKQTEMGVLEISSAVCGFHVYNDIWKPSIGDNLICETEFNCCFDKFAIKVASNRETVGHLPRKFLKIAWYRFDFILVFWG